jgi:ribosomal protein S18 acetylase RimI-like enzyme
VVVAPVAGLPEDDGVNSSASAGEPGPRDAATSDGGPAVRLRPAEPADAAAVTAVFLASRAAAMPYLPDLHTDEETAWWITHVMLPGHRVWVAEQDPDRRIVGFAALAGTMLEHLYLHPDVRRRGIGTRLLDQVRVASPHELTLHVFQRNTAARAFYERHGFRLVHAGDGSGNEEREPDALYRWCRD